MPGRQGFLLAEDEALKARFTGITVTDDRMPAGRPTQVFFRYPDNVTERTYPFLTLELLDVTNAHNRQHSDQPIYGWTDTATPRPDWAHGPAWFDYWPDETTDLRTEPTANNVVDPVYVGAEEFVPVDLLYQISTYARSALHDRELTSWILRRVIPFRRGFLDVPVDNSRRYLTMLDWITADLLDQEAGYRKRIFRKIYTISVTAELPSTLLYGVGRAQSVNIAYKTNPTGDPLS